MIFFRKKRDDAGALVRANLRALARLERSLRILEQAHESGDGLETPVARLVQHAINASLRDLKHGRAYEVGIRALEASLGRQRAIRERRGEVAW